MLGDAEPDAQWQDAGGDSRELYIIPGQEGEDASVYMLMQIDVRSEPLVSLVGSIPAHLFADGVEPAVQVDDQGGVTVTFGDGEDVDVLKFRTQMKIVIREGPGPGELEQPIDAGGISITVTPAERGQE